MAERRTLLRRELIAPLAVFLIALLSLCALAGRKRLLEPSKNNHYAHLAQGWLEGRLHHEGKPPGYCTAKLRRAKKCRGHSYDDWARVWTLELRDGELVRGYPCMTEDCQALRREGVEAWLVLGVDRQLREIRSRDIAKRTDTWYVSFPPGPALVMMPAVLARGTQARDVLWTCMIAALIPVILLQLFDRERGTADGRGREHLWAVAAWTFASPTIQQLFQHPMYFGAMVERGYPMVWTPGEVSFPSLREEDGRPVQRVQIVDGTGRLHLLDYEMVEIDGNWRIAGVTILRGELLGV